MPATHDPDGPRREAEVSGFVWQQIRLVLERERDRIYEEITTYPPPIPACDAQFNHLLEQRERVSRDLARVNEAAQLPGSLAACGELLDEMVAGSGLIAADAEQKLRSYLRVGA
jgi:hypothetical protein